MLDKSGSMGWRMGGGTVGMRYPYDADADSNGDIMVSQYYRDGVKKFVYGSATVDTGFGKNGVSGKGDARYEGNNQCRTSYSYSGETYNDVYYTTAYWERSVVAIRASDGKCLKKYYVGFYPYNMTIDQSTGYLYVGGWRGYKTINIPLVMDQKIPKGLMKNEPLNVIGLVADPERLADIRRNRVAIMKNPELKDYTLSLIHI